MEPKEEDNTKESPQDELSEEIRTKLNVEDDLRVEGYNLSWRGMDLGWKNTVAVPTPEVRPWQVPGDGGGSSGLCAACQALFLSEDRVTQSAYINKGPPIGFVPEKLDLFGGQHHKFVGDCNDAAEKGCPICFIIMEWALDCGTNNSLKVQQGRFSEYTFRKGADNPWSKIHAENAWLLEMSLRSIGAARGIPMPVAISKYHTDFVVLPVKSEISAVP